MDIFNLSEHLEGISWLQILYIFTIWAFGAYVTKFHELESPKTWRWLWLASSVQSTHWLPFWDQGVHFSALWNERRFSDFSMLLGSDQSPTSWWPLDVSNQNGRAARILWGTPFWDADFYEWIFAEYENDFEIMADFDEFYNIFCSRKGSHLKFNKIERNKE